MDLKNLKAKEFLGKNSFGSNKKGVMYLENTLLKITIYRLLDLFF